jgi:hypothetical protein
MDKEKLKQCLEDSGCHENTLDSILNQFESGSLEGVFHLLKKERCLMMDAYHECGRKIDCMDFMLREFEKEINNGGIRR